MKINNCVFVLDVDGVVSSPYMFYSLDGKFMKMFGCDDWDLLKKLSQHIDIQFISADKKGFLITEKRIKIDMNMPLAQVTNKPQERWSWIQDNFPNRDIIFMGDGWGDYISLQNAHCGITTVDALDHVKQSANVVIPRRGSERAVAEAIIYICKNLLDIDIISNND